MERWCYLLLLFGGAVPIHTAPLVGSTLSSPNSEAIKKAIDIYNARRNSSFLFRLLNTDPQYTQVGCLLLFPTGEMIIIYLPSQLPLAAAIFTSGFHANIPLRTIPCDKQAHWASCILYLLLNVL
uniref:Uncharacterized protein n=1 Tax=Xenopus tropicalis TaxID=8364 RepID=A0A6I8RPH5_XENTR